MERSRGCFDIKEVNNKEVNKMLLDEMRSLRDAQFPQGETYDRGQIAALEAIQALKEFLPPKEIEKIVNVLSEASSPNAVSNKLRELLSF